MVKTLQKKYSSRSARTKKRRKNERLLYSFIGVAVLFVIMLSVFVFTGKNKVEQANKTKETNVTEITESDNLMEESPDEAQENEKAAENEEASNLDHFDEDVVVQEIESNDPNVIEALVGNWEPVGTTQEEPHTTNYTDESDDRREIKEAIMYVTNIVEDNLTEHWVGNGGEQKVIAHVEDQSTQDKYTVYLSWVEDEGWQPTLVERVEELNIP